MDPAISNNVYQLSKEGIFPPDWVFRDASQKVIYKKPSKNTITKTTETIIEGRKNRAQCHIHKQPPSLDARITLLPRKGSKVATEQTVVFQKRPASGKEIYEFEYEGRIFRWGYIDDLLTRSIFCEMESVDANDQAVFTKVATYEHQSTLDYQGRLFIHKGLFPEVRDPKGLEILLVATYTLYDEALELKRRRSSLSAKRIEC